MTRPEDPEIYPPLSDRERFMFLAGYASGHADAMDLAIDTMGEVMKPEEWGGV